MAFAGLAFDDAKVLIQAPVSKWNWCRNNRGYGSFAGCQHFHDRGGADARGFRFRRYLSSRRSLFVAGGVISHGFSAVL